MGKITYKCPECGGTIFTVAFKIFREVFDGGKAKGAMSMKPVNVKCVSCGHEIDGAEVENSL